MHLPSEGSPSFVAGSCSGYKTNTVSSEKDSAKQARRRRQLSLQLKPA
jgi:hypothetical protein